MESWKPETSSKEQRVKSCIKCQILVFVFCFGELEHIPTSYCHKMPKACLSQVWIQQKH